MPRANRKRKRSKSRRVVKGTGRKHVKPTRYKKALALTTHNFVERLKPDTIILNNTTLDVNGNLLATKVKEFNLNLVPQMLHYQALFEYYKIDKIVVNFRYKCSGQYANTTPGVGVAFNEINPIITFKVDHDDIALDPVVKLMESMKTKEKQLTNSQPNFAIQLKPAIQTEAYKNALTSTYVPKWGQWLTTQDPTVPHYGLKMQVQCPAASGNAEYGQIMVQYKMYFSVKNNE